MQNLIEGINAQVLTLRERFAKTEEFLKNINDASSKLASDRATALQEANVINGAIQAYNNVLAEYQKAITNDSEVQDVIEINEMEQAERDKVAALAGTL